MLPNTRHQFGDLHCSFSRQIFFLLTIVTKHSQLRMLKVQLLHACEVNTCDFSIILISILLYLSNMSTKIILPFLLLSIVFIGICSAIYFWCWPISRWLEQCFITLSGFSIEGGTRRLIAAYFGIYSRLLCV